MPVGNGNNSQTGSEVSKSAPYTTVSATATQRIDGMMTAPASKETAFCHGGASFCNERNNNVWIRMEHASRPMPVGLCQGWQTGFIAGDRSTHERQHFVHTSPSGININFEGRIIVELKVGWAANPRPSTFNTYWGGCSPSHSWQTVAILCLNGRWLRNYMKKLCT